MREDIFIVEDVMEARWAGLAQLCEETIDAELLREECDSNENLSRKNLCEFLGIQESTLSGWFKDDRVPRMAKAAYGLSLIANLLKKEVRRLRDEATEPKIVVSGNSYMLCKFTRDEDDLETGQILAEGIRDFQTALRFRGVSKSLKLIREADHLVRDEIENREGCSPVDWLQELSEEFASHLGLSVDVEKWRKLWGETGRKRLVESIDLSLEGKSDAD